MVKTIRQRLILISVLLASALLSCGGESGSDSHPSDKAIGRGESFKIL